MKTKVLLEDKLVTWKRAYGYVLEELLAGLVMPDRRDTIADQLAGATIVGDLRAAAGRTAAVLIQGVSHDGDSSAD